MIYSKVENPKCNTCVYADIKENSGNALCKFKGMVPADFCCKKYKYDIFKKKVRPRKKLSAKKFTEDDFKI